MSANTDRWLAVTLLVLAGGLGLNSVAGPLVLDLVSYPFSETLVNQTVGLEAVTLVFVVPWCIAAAVLVWRGHRAGPIVAIPPAAYAAYMFLQYVVGPQYLSYRPHVVFHLAIFVASGAVLVLAWNAIRRDALPDMSRRRERYAGVAVLLMAGFAFLQYVPAIGRFLTSAPLGPEQAADPTMYWSIFFLDLGIVVPVALATGIGLLRGRAWAHVPAYAVVGWFTLVPISVAAMGLAMWLNGDPNAAVGRVAVLSVAAVAFTAFTGWLYSPLFGRVTSATAIARVGRVGGSNTG